MLIAYSTNLGLTRMADARGVSYEVLAWTAKVYLRKETLRPANPALIGRHHELPVARRCSARTPSPRTGSGFLTRGSSAAVRAGGGFLPAAGRSPPRGSGVEVFRSDVRGGAAVAGGTAGEGRPSRRIGPLAVEPT
ncbi:Tn3 family transposase [Actinomadura miaoliensis]|uniref:Tn3 transposase DDE domain-containing protein n=1 Tax=Actinomadura miaoliensis TaxID=430685 RepID=A0ABP7VL11_9ACTN